MNHSQVIINRFRDLGVEIKDLAEILYDLQSPYFDDLEIDYCKKQIFAVLEKREVQHAVLTGLEIDRLVDEQQFKEPIQSIIETDDPLYGVDEILALSITNVFGTISLTNFGYLDKVKPKIIGELDQKKEGSRVATMLDDLLCAIISSAASRMAHAQRN